MPSRNFASIRDYEDFSRGMALDPHHTELSPDQFLHEPKTETYVWEDAQGAVYYWRISREIRVDVQFRPDVSRRRTCEGIRDGVLWLAEEVKPEFRAIVFDSVHRPLIAFCKRRLQFHDSPDIRKVV